MKYIIVRSFNNPFSDYMFTLNTLGSPIEKVNYIWKQPSFVKEHSSLLRINKTVFRKKTNTVCRYMTCVANSSSCHYSERYIFDFNNNTLVVEATNTQKCLCSLTTKVKHQTYDQIKNYFSECNENSTITPTIVQEKLLSANQSGQQFCIPSKVLIKHIKHNMTRKVSVASSFISKRIIISLFQICNIEKIQYSK